MKSFNTLRLFYNKYPYKISISLPRDRNLYENETYIKVSKLKEEYPQIKMRREWHTVSVFSFDSETHNSIKENFIKNIIEVHEPDETQLKYLTSNNRIEIRNKLTHGCRYRIKLGKLDKNMNFDRFLKLVEKHPDEFVIPGYLNEFFLKNHRYFYGTPYFFIKSEKFLTMAQLVYPGPIKETVTIMTPEEIEESNQCQTI